MISITTKKISCNGIIAMLNLMIVCLWMLMPLVYGIFISIDNIEYMNVFSKIQYQIGYIALALSLTKFLIRYREDNSFLKKEIARQNLHVVFIGCLLIWSFISALNASNYEISFNGQAYRLEGFMRYISYVGFFFLGYLSTNKKYIKRFMQVFLFPGCILSSITVVNFIITKIRGELTRQITSVFFNANHYGYYLTMIIICAGSVMLMQSNKFTEKIFYMVTFILSSLALIINNTFGSYLAVFFGLIFVIIAFKLCRKNVMKKSVGILLLFLGISIAMNLKYGVITRNFSQTTGEVKNISEGVYKDTSGLNRWELWKDAVKFTIEKPILGYGPDSLEEPYLREGNNLSDRPHNIFLQLSASLGIPALLMYIAILAIIYIKNLKIRDKISDSGLIAICVTVAYLMSSFFGNSMYYTSSYYIIFLGLCSRIATKDDEEYK